MYHSIFEEYIDLYLIILYLFTEVKKPNPAIYQYEIIFISGFDSGNMHHVYYLLHLSYNHL